MLSFCKVNIKQEKGVIFIMPTEGINMSEGSAEMPTIKHNEHERPRSLVKDNEVERENFANASTEDLIVLRKTSRIILSIKGKTVDQEQLQFAEQTYKGSSLEIFFRLHGDKYRDDYNKWIEIKRKKQGEWEQQMLAKYGKDWEQQVTDEDHKQLIYSAEELETYALHKEIEKKAMDLNKKDINDLCKKEKIRNPEKRKSFFKLVKMRTLNEYQFLGEREVHKAVYSAEFLFFYMRQTFRAAARQGINSMRGKEINYFQEAERNLVEAVNFVRDLVIRNKLKPKNKIVIGVPAIRYYG